MRILGVDPAMSVTGYGVVEFSKDKRVLISAGIIKTDPRKSLAERLAYIYEDIHTIILKTKPQMMVLEKLYAHYRHPTTAYILGHARGVIALACAQAGIPLIEYAATRVKKAIVGDGLAAKYQVQRMVAGILNLKLELLPRYTDVTDALALAIAHSYIVRQQNRIGLK